MDPAEFSLNKNFEKLSIKPSEPNQQVKVPEEETAAGKEKLRYEIAQILTKLKKRLNPGVLDEEDQERLAISQELLEKMEKKQKEERRAQKLKMREELSKKQRG